VNDGVPTAWDPDEVGRTRRGIEGVDRVSFEPELDFRRLLLPRAFLMRLVVGLELDVPSVSSSLDESDSDEELEEFNISASTPG
jgi:hypothetical protein